VADNVTQLLEGVLSSGTAAGRGLDRPAAGKTGTAQNNRDAWFVGYTPTLSTAVWIGYQNPPGQEPKALVNIKGARTVTGGSHPARIWQAFMRQALRGVPVTEFNEPAPIEAVPDAARRRQRGGFEPERMRPTEIGPGEVAEEDLSPPAVEAPTTTIPEVPSTTSTTRPTTGSTLLPP
jgi:membrane peptidoglycan carboxypeptidase